MENLMIWLAVVVAAAGEILLPLVATVLVTIAVPAALKWIEASGVVKDEARMRILQSALENAALTALKRAGAHPVEGLGGLGTDAAIDYVRKSVPETVAKLGLDDGMIIDLVTPHLERLLRRNEK